MSAHVLLNFLKEFRKSDKMRDLPIIFSLFRNTFNNKFNNTRARMLDSIYNMTLKLLEKLHLWCENIKILLSLTQCYDRCH